MWFHAQFANKSWTDSNTRFYPELKKDQLRNGNVLPRTCVLTQTLHILQCHPTILCFPKKQVEEVYDFEEDNEDDTGKDNSFYNEHVLITMFKSKSKVNTT